MPPIEAYELGSNGEHIPVPTGDSPPGGSGAHTTETGLPAETATGDVPGAQGGSAPQERTPPSGEGVAAPQVTEEDDADVPDDTATVPFVNRRIKQLNAKRRALEQQVAAERQQFQQEQAATRAQVELLTRMLQGSAPDLPPAPAHPAGPPQPETYATHDEYVRAAARYEAQQEFQARDQQTQQERQREQMQQMQRELLEREQAFKAQHPDFDQVVRAGLAGKVAPHVQQALMMLPDGPALAYTLAQQQDLVQKLNTLPPPLVFAELGRLSGPGSGPPSPATQDSAHADVPGRPSANGTRPPPLPEPLRPVGGGGSPTPPGFRDDMSQAEYRAWRARTSQLPKWRTG